MQKITEIDVLAEFNRLISEMLELGDPDRDATPEVQARLATLNARFRELDQQINSAS